MGSVWVVEKGRYSDYRVVGVFSTKENAEKMAFIVGGSVNEWPIDPWLEQINQGLFIYRISMKRDGTVISIVKDDYEYSYEETGLLLDRIWDGDSWDESFLVGTVVAKDEDHAVKIANEIRTQRIADGSWPE